jgi:hypothetical protein
MKSVSETKCAHSSKCRKTVYWETPNAHNRHTKTEIKLQENWDKTWRAVRLWNAKLFCLHRPCMGHSLIIDRTFRSQFLQFDKPQKISRVQKVAFYSRPYFISTYLCESTLKKLHGLSPRPNYTDRATAACRRSDCQFLRIEGATWSAWRIPTAVFSVF